VSASMNRRSALRAGGIAAGGLVLGSAAGRTPATASPLPGDRMPPRPVAPVNQEIAAAFGANYKTLPQQVVGVDVDALLGITSEQDIQRARQGLIQYVWKQPTLPTDLPTVRRDVTVSALAPLTGVARVDELRVPLAYQVTSTVYQIWPDRPYNRRIALYHNGHGEPLDTMWRTVQALLDRGYSVLVFAMPFFHWNVQPIADPNDPTKPVTITSHNQLAPWESPTFSTLTFFLQPLTVALNHAIATARPTSVQMIGLSGGGWATTVYPAIDPRVTRSYPTAGSFPFYLRPGAPTPNPTIGDWEQRQDKLPGFYANADFLDLYVMAASGRGRRQLQIVNRFDACCFNGVGFRSYEAVVRDRVLLLAGGDPSLGHYEILNDATHDQHTISPYALSVILWDLETRTDHEFPGG
jgi:hypothetical protein